MKKKQTLTLIRFEDRYGVATIAQELCMLLHEGMDIESLGYVFENGKDDEGVLKIGEDTLADYYCSGIRRIIVVFDLDGDRKDGRQFVTEESLSSKFNRLRRRLHESKLDILLEYLPTVYFAETLLLYQHYNKLSCIPELCVSKYSTVTLQTSILRVLNKLRSERDVKRCTEYVNTAEILSNISGKTFTYNDRLFKVLLSLDSHGLSEMEAVSELHYALQLFEVVRNLDIEILVEGVLFTPMMTIDEMRGSVSEYLVEAGILRRKQ